MNTAQGLLQFPPEIREHFFYYCTKSDLVNISRCSKAYYTCVKYLLWDKIQFTWLNVERGLSTKILENLKWTSSLGFYNDDKDSDEEDNDEAFMQFHCDIMNNSDDNDNNSDDDDDDDDGNDDDDADDDDNEDNEDNDGNDGNGADYSINIVGGTPKSKVTTWIELASNYRKILSYCDCNRLTKLDIVGVIGSHGINQTVDILCNLQQLSMSDISLISSNGWLNLIKLIHLKKLSLLNCVIQDSSVEEIIAATKLEEIILNQCSLREISLVHISHAVQLKRVTISHNSYIPGSSFKVLSTLTNLVQLNLKYTYIDDIALSNICMSWKNLKILNLHGSINITDSGLYSVSNLQSLKELNINMCTNITNLGFSYLEKIPIRKLSFSWSNNVSDTLFDYLTNVVSLKELSIININNRFSIVAIDEFCEKTNMKKQTVFNSWIFSFFTLKKDY